MNTTTLRVARYAGVGLAGIATSCVLAAPAQAMRPDPTPGGGQRDPGTTNSQVTEHDATTNPTRGGVSTTDGIDWSSLAAGFGSGAMLTGVVVIGATQLHRRQARPA